MMLFKYGVVIASVFLLACQGQRTEVIREVIRDNPGPTVQPQYTGGTDSGGGNSVSGRPIESYARNIFDETVVKTHIIPLISKLHEIHPRFASDLIHIGINRTWYILPVELNKIPSSVLGVSFSDSQLEQMALQNLKAIYINSTLFEKSDRDEDRALLILHEMVMGVFLMKYKDALDECYSNIAWMRLYSKNHNLYRNERASCAIKNIYSNSSDLPITNLGKKMSLSTEDYDNIRELVVNLWQNLDHISFDELDAWLKQNSNRKY